MKTQTEAQRLADKTAALVQTLRRTPMPLADLIPHLQAQADELRRLEAEVKALLATPPVLTRDLAEILGSTVPAVCAALVEAGRPPRSTNMAVSGEEALEVAQALRGAVPAGSLALDAALGYIERNTPHLVYSEIKAALAAAPQPTPKPTGLIVSKHFDPLTGAGIPDPTTFGEKQ
jgi:hypothetical protein